MVCLVSKVPVNKSPLYFRPLHFTSICIWAMTTLVESKSTILFLFVSIICPFFLLQYARQLINLYMRRDVVGGITRQVMAGSQVIYYFDKSVPNMPARVSNSLPPRLSLRILANYHFLGYMLLLLLISSYASGYSIYVVTCLAFFAWIVFMIVRWLFGQVPLVPIVSVHDVSDSRPNFSFWWPWKLI